MISVWRRTLPRLALRRLCGSEAGSMPAHLVRSAAGVHAAPAAGAVGVEEEPAAMVAAAEDVQRRLVEQVYGADGDRPQRCLEVNLAQGRPCPLTVPDGLPRYAAAVRASGSRSRCCVSPPS